MKDGEIKISVVIPAHNEESSIGDCVKGILSQNYPEKEVIVVNDGSADRTSEIAKSLGAIVIDFDRGHSAAFARNAGAKKASGNVVYFVDADVILRDKSILSRLAEDFGAADAVGFRFVPDEPKTFIQKSLGVGYSLLPYDGVKKVFSNASEGDTVRGFHAIRRDLFLELGGFNEGIFYFEDRELHNRFYSKGYKALYDPSLVMHAIDPQSWPDFVRQCNWLGRGLYEYYRQTGILHYRSILFWMTYVFSGIASLFHCAFMALFAVMSLGLAAWILKLTLKTGDLIHSTGYVLLHYIRATIVSLQFVRHFLTDREAGG